jgi:phosphatidylserine decarboxylase
MTLATVVLGGATAALIGWFWPLAAVPIVIWVWAISFFRDPERVVPDEPGILVAPADGTVTQILELDHDDQIGGPARRISIFLSVFSVHINRSPCNGQVRSVAYQKGEFINALSPDSSHRNEANTVVLSGVDGAPSTIVVRQIVGLIARRIVCHARVGDRLATGQRFGMIKFGSRTELTIPRREGDRVLVHVGQGVHAGETILIRLADGTRKDE